MSSDDENNFSLIQIRASFNLSTFIWPHVQTIGVEAFVGICLQDINIRETDFILQKWALNSTKIAAPQIMSFTSHLIYWVSASTKTSTWGPSHQLLRPEKTSGLRVSWPLMSGASLQRKKEAERQHTTFT